jgi:glutaconate CoA-transferase subunit A
MSQFMSLAAAVEANVRDGDTVAMEGFTHLIPHAAGHEVIRQQRRHLTLIRMTPDLIYDQLIGMGCADKAMFAWCGNPGVGSLHRMRDAIENGWPQPLAYEEHSHAAMANAYDAGAAGLPFAVFRGYIGVDLPSVNANIRSITCPYTGEKLATVPAIRPDVAIIHAPSPAPIPARSWRRCRRSGPTSQSSTRCAPTVAATCSWKASSACRSRRYWRRSARS